ncbi:hypothetical protein [Parasphingorhabdus pacifica]
MACTAHLLTMTTQPEPAVVVRDVHGGARSEVALAPIATPDEADTELHSAGWTRQAEWAGTKAGS